MWKVSDTFRAEVEALTAQPITDRQVGDVLTPMWPDDPTATARARDNASRRRAEIRRMYQSDPRVAGWHGTAYGLVQAVSTWELWEAPRPRPARRAGPRRTVRRHQDQAVDAAERLTALA